MLARSLLVLPVLLLVAVPAAAQSFVNFETPHVHPLDLTPDGTRLLLVNTADARLEVFDVTGASPALVDSVPVGLDPVSVRARSDAEAWVVNQLSDSVSVVDLVTGRVRATVSTGDEPADVVFAGTPERAFVSISQENRVEVLDPADLSLAPVEVDVFGEDPRALAVSPDGATVYVAVFESGNGSTVLGGANAMGGGGFPPNVVDDPSGPYGGTNPPPNAGAVFDPPQDPLNPAPPRVSLIVKKDGSGNWMDDNGGDWTDLVSGAQAAKSGRPVGWDLPDHDVAVIDAATLGVTYVDRLMNVVMALDVDPVDGRLAVVGTDGTNEIRFEPVINGTFLRVQLALVDPAGPTSTFHDLNDHLDYSTPSVPQALRDLSVGDPRGVAWDATGTRAWVTGMGSNNVVVVDGSGARAGLAPTIEVGEGPTGIVLDGASGRAFVLNRFEATLSVLDVATETETARVPFHDATPQAIVVGRRHLYDTHERSGLGHVACGSCHVDARMDQLAWDLGDPGGDMVPTAGMNLAAGLPFLGGGFPDFHPMKGPMTTQTLQDIIGKEPLHWRGDRLKLQEFNPAFTGLQGDDVMLSPAEMQEFADYLATIHFPPNPFRNLDNTLSTSVPLDGFHTTGDFGPAGQPLGPGDAVAGLALFRPPNLFDGGAVACVTCHTLPTGLGTDYTLNGFVFQPIPPGPDGERHHALVNIDGTTAVSMKVPHMRNLHEKRGFDMTQVENTAGFGFVHDGSVDTMARFIGEPVFSFQDDQQIADMVAFMVSFPGSDLPAGSTTNLLEPPGTASKDAHAAVGVQTTLEDASAPAPGQLALIGDLLALVDAGAAVDVVVKGVQGGLDRGYLYLGGALFQSDRADESLTEAALRAGAAPGAELTYTVLPAGTGLRLGIDRDEDGFLDRDELDAGSDPADPDSVPGALVDVHVADVAVSVTSPRRRVAGGGGGLGGAGFGVVHRAAGVVRVEDDQGQPVGGAEVSVTWSGPVSGAASALTDPSGEAVFTSPASSLDGCFVLTVDGVAAAGLSHDTGADVETTDQAGAGCP